MKLQVLIQLKGETKKTFIQKTTDKNIVEVKKALDEICLKGKVFHAFIANNKKAWIYDPNSFRNNSLLFEISPYAVHSLPSYFTEISEDGIFKDWRPNDVDEFFFKPSEENYEVYFPCLSKTSINRFFRNFFIQQEITDEKLKENLANCDGQFDSEAILVENNANQDLIDFINNQVEFIFNVMVKNKSAFNYYDDYEFFKDYCFIPEPIRHEVNNGSGTDRYDFGDWTKND